MQKLLDAIELHKNEVNPGEMRPPLHEIQQHAEIRFSLFAMQSGKFERLCEGVVEYGENLEDAMNICS